MQKKKAKMPTARPQIFVALCQTFGPPQPIIIRGFFQGIQIGPTINSTKHKTEIMYLLAPLFSNHLSIKYKTPPNDTINQKPVQIPAAVSLEQKNNFMKT